MIKLSFESVQVKSENSFLTRLFDVEAFDAPFHYHPEVELTVILKGRGKRYVGTSMEDYHEGDLILLGPDLPHCWKSENEQTGVKNSSSIVVQFPLFFLGPDFFGKPELNSISRLLEKSRYGIQFLNETAFQTKEKLVQLQSETDPFKRLIYLLEILHSLADSRHYRLLNQVETIVHYSDPDHKRINEITSYIVENFRKAISLEEAAANSKMSVSSFCRYFKKIHRSTFMDVVTDYRINYAAQQLIHSDIPISVVGYESGFNDASNFHRKFKKKKKLSPLAYRNRFRKGHL